MKYAHILTAFFGSPWAIAEDKYQQIRALLLERASGRAATEADIVAAVGQRRQGGYSVVGKTAVIPIMGVIAPRVGQLEESSGGIGADAIGQQIDAAAADKTVSKIVLQIDSPGGSVYGVQELAAKIRSARDQKKVVAVADHVAASAAYWLGSQASEFYVSPSGQVGSIGVIAEHVDESARDERKGIKTTLIKAGEFKQEGHPSQPLSAEALAAVQTTINTYYESFLGDVAKGRGVTVANVRENYGKGRMMTAGDAKAAGMVDGIATFETVMRRLGSEVSKSAATARARLVEIS